MTSYQKFKQNKLDYGCDNGFEPYWIPDFLFDFQKAFVEKAIRRGRSAIFADCGMGKSVIEFVWGQNVINHTNKPVLLITPLAVSFQMLEEAEKFGVEMYRASGIESRTAIHVTNYEQLHKLSPHNYDGIICDESSILKNDKGKYAAIINEFMRTVPYRLLATATAAPNDWTELGMSSEALGYLGNQDMLGKFFTNKTNSAALRKFQGDRETWHLRPWAEKGPFWQWVASWAHAARKPSDLGFDDGDFILPGLIENDVYVQASMNRAGMLFEVAARNWQEEREVIRTTITERCEMATERALQHDLSMMWCNLNNESSLLKRIVPNSVEITGTTCEEEREEAVKWFIHGSDTQRRLISKPKIFGFGMNFQHAHHTTYFPTHSYEKYYQSLRRLLRFGQMEKVIADRILTKGISRILENLDRKARDADKMFSKLVMYMNDGMIFSNDYQEITDMEVPQWM